MSRKVNRLQSVQPLDNLVLEATYTSGQAIRVDLTDLVARLAVFAPLQNRQVFNQVAVADWGHSVAWSEDASLDADRLLEMALEQAGRTDTLEFRRWQDRYGLSLTAAAQAIGLSRRSISQFRMGHRAVPRTVLLACKGWEVEHRQQQA